MKLIRQHEPKLPNNQEFAQIFACFAAVANEDASSFARELARLLKLNSRQKTVFRMFHIVCTDAHCIYNLTERVMPHLVKEFDITHSLPWDSEMHFWQLENPEYQIDLRLQEFSPTLSKWFTELPGDYSGDHYNNRQLRAEFVVESS